MRPHPRGLSVMLCLVGQCFTREFILAKGGPTVFWWMCGIVGSSMLRHVVHCHATMKLFSTITPADVSSALDIMTSTLSSTGTKHGVEHHTSTEGPPVHAKACRLEHRKLALASDEFTAMEGLDIIWWSKSPWASSLHLVPKLVDGPFVSQRISCPVRWFLVPHLNNSVICWTG